MKCFSPRAVESDADPEITDAKDKCGYKNDYEGQQRHIFRKKGHNAECEQQQKDSNNKIRYSLSHYFSFRIVSRNNIIKLLIRVQI
jgi:hypothetical protein